MAGGTLVHRSCGHLPAWQTKIVRPPSRRVGCATMLAEGPGDIARRGRRSARRDSTTLPRGAARPRRHLSLRRSGTSAARGRFGCASGRAGAPRRLARADVVVGTGARTGLELVPASAPASRLFGRTVRAAATSSSRSPSRACSCARTAPRRSRRARVGPPAARAVGLTSARAPTSSSSTGSVRARSRSSTRPRRSARLPRPRARPPGLRRVGQAGRGALDARCLAEAVVAFMDAEGSARPTRRQLDGRAGGARAGMEHPTASVARAAVPRRGLRAPRFAPLVRLARPELGALPHRVYPAAVARVAAHMFGDPARRPAARAARGRGVPARLRSARARLRLHGRRRATSTSTPRSGVTASIPAWPGSCRPLCSCGARTIA